MITAETIENLYRKYGFKPSDKVYLDLELKLACPIGILYLENNNYNPFFVGYSLIERCINPSIILAWGYDIYGIHFITGLLNGFSKSPGIVSSEFEQKYPKWVEGNTLGKNLREKLLPKVETS